MLVQSELNKLSDSARVWIYQSNREFTDSESQEIREAASQFVQSWKAHEVQLLAAAEVLYNRFIVLSVDENIAGASGCSIDKSVKFIRAPTRDILLDQIRVLQQASVKVCTIKKHLDLRFALRK